VQHFTSQLFFSLKKKLAGSNEEALMVDESLNFRRFSLAAHMHGMGINMRHLGRVRSHISDKGLRVFLLSEMVARVAKQILRLLLFLSLFSPFSLCFLFFFLLTFVI
jgi:hypothetical protein